MQQPDNEIIKLKWVFSGCFVITLREPNENGISEVYIGTGKTSKAACKAAIRRLKRLIRDVEKLAAKEE